jgi:hypothetical protein
MAVLTDSGRAAIATSIKNLDIHLAWGAGSPGWDTTPVGESVGASTLLNEVGRRKVSQVMYCVPDTSGGLIVPDGKFSPSATPTKYLYLRFAFDFNDSPVDTIREVGVFVRTVPKPSVPSGQAYLLPAEVLTPGELVVIQHIAKIERSGAIRQQFEFVIEF